MKTLFVPAIAATLAWQAPTFAVGSVASDLIGPATRVLTRPLIGGFSSGIALIWLLVETKLVLSEDLGS